MEAHGQVRLVGAVVTGSVECSGGTFDADGASHALFFDRIRVGGNLDLAKGFSASGSVSAAGARINGDLNCVNGTFSNPGSTAFDPASLSINIQDLKTTLGVFPGHGGEWHQRTTDVGIDQVGVDVRFPEGLFRANNRGTQSWGWRWFEIQFRVTGSGDPWTDVTSIKGTPEGVRFIAAGQGSPAAGGSHL